MCYNIKRIACALCAAERKNFMPKNNRDDLLSTRKTQILEATCRCLKDKPCSALTIKEVAEEAGVAYGLVHYYFNSKEQLFREMAAYILLYYEKVLLEELELLKEKPLTKEAFLEFFREYHRRIFQSENAYYEHIWLELCVMGRFDKELHAVLSGNDYSAHVTDAIAPFFANTPYTPAKIYSALMTYMEGMNVYVTLYGTDPETVIARGEALLSHLFDRLDILA